MKEQFREFAKKLDSRRHGGKKTRGRRFSLRLGAIA